MSVLFSQDAPKARRFLIWSICFLVLIILSTFTIFLAQVTKGPSEPFVSATLSRTNVFGANKAISIQVSNEMSFNVGYWIDEEVLYRGKWTPVITAGSSRLKDFGFSPTGHFSNNRRFFVSPE